MSKKKPFNELETKTKVVVISSLSFIILLGIALVLGVLFLGMVGLFQVLGVTYESNRSLILFGVLVFVIGAFFELLSKLLISLSLRYQFIRSQRVRVKIAVDLLVTWTAVYIVDEIVASVSMHFWSQWIFALLLVALDYAFDDRKLKQKKLA
ncbi:regulatory YrvL family protein [Halobacillus sp. A1]|uniref:regulatory YrvL family protein n=1 Tax=Halobacillus sp. A1 TaxID=2880262 RepID=UPI0020A67A5B|nr:regulatory YrvL family protein [Halobacillus sp. A1]MCP3030991.1 regulatory YrvL family protein [Halobacillus sp. A1]